MAKRTSKVPAYAHDALKTELSDIRNINVVISSIAEHLNGYLSRFPLPNKARKGDYESDAHFRVANLLLDIRLSLKTIILCLEYGADPTSIPSKVLPMIKVQGSSVTIGDYACPMCLGVVPQVGRFHELPGVPGIHTRELRTGAGTYRVTCWFKHTQPIVKFPRLVYHDVYEYGHAHGHYYLDLRPYTTYADDRTSWVVHGVNKAELDALRTVRNRYAMAQKAFETGGVIADKLMIHIPYPYTVFCSMLSENIRKIVEVSFVLRCKLSHFPDLHYSKYKNIHTKFFKDKLNRTILNHMYKDIALVHPKLYGAQGENVYYKTNHRFRVLSLPSTQIS
jgi:hypothetical protein